MMIAMFVSVLNACTLPADRKAALALT
jgi:hypothetical protein